MPSGTVQREIPPPTPPTQPDSDAPEMRGQGVHAKALRIRFFCSEIGMTPGCPACETPRPGKSHTRECKAHQDAWEESRQTARAEEAKRGFDEDPDTRPLIPSSSSTDLEPKRTETDEGHLQMHIRRNLPVTRACRRKRESQETCFTSLVRVN